MAAVERFCHRAMLIQDGRIVVLGEPRDVARAYLEANFEARDPAAPPPEASSPFATIHDVWVERDDGRRADELPYGESFYLCSSATIHETLPQGGLNIAMTNEQGVLVFAATSYDDATIETLSPGDHLVVRTRAENLLRPGRYGLAASVTRGRQSDVVALQGQARVITVYGSARVLGAANLPGETLVERTAGAGEPAPVEPA
jgi:hypothetical protein